MGDLSSSTVGFYQKLKKIIFDFLNPFTLQLHQVILIYGIFSGSFFGNLD